VLEWMVGKERLGPRATWVQEGAARDIDSEGGGGAHGFCVYWRKGETERI